MWNSLFHDDVYIPTARRPIWQYNSAHTYTLIDTSANQPPLHNSSFHSSKCRSQRLRETSLHQDTQLTRIPPQKESCSLVQRRKEIGASLRDASLLCAAAGFAKNAAELRPWHVGKEFILAYKHYCYYFFLCCYGLMLVALSRSESYYTIAYYLTYLLISLL